MTWGISRYEPSISHRGDISRRHSENGTVLICSLLDADMSVRFLGWPNVEIVAYAEVLQQTVQRIRVYPVASWVGAAQALSQRLHLAGELRVFAIGQAARCHAQVRICVP